MARSKFARFSEEAQLDKVRVATSCGHAIFLTKLQGQEGSNMTGIVANNGLLHATIPFQVMPDTLIGNAKHKPACSPVP